MAYSNVHGTPVTGATLKGMTEYHDKEIKAVDRARVALEMKNAEGKDSDARRSNDTIGKGVSCLIYNATGGPLKLVTAFQYTGWVEAFPYPSLLQNGQYGSFVFLNTSDASSMAVVYEDTQDPKRQWVLGWRRIPGTFNKCYAEIREPGHYSRGSSDSVRRSLQLLIDSSDDDIHEIENNGNMILSSFGNAPFPVYEAILTIKAAL
ncbi:23 kDa jasmonate-induced protein-like [Silene latifolia]|uniref:23 kDa jasmonate-induced protein-like n=1 Tax=Silene latifolia TaxID=37657 RepID=UPI003D77DF3F